jgi:2-amino-4-hydroxy-6-hydroxymethyldihydropteridine diphosphokinase
MPRVGIALGSNLGDRIRNIQAAVERLREIAVADEPVLCAQVYQTEPMLCPPGSPDFYNSTIEISFSGRPSELLELTQAFEKNLGRSPAVIRNSPRVIDIDLLYFGDEMIDTEDLVLPHPRIAERRFVLQPLADIRPDLVLPGQHRTVAELLDALGTREPPLVSAHI